ncbi:MAG: cell division protein ZapE [Alphaproteobacteria bacterium]|nr:cell division protein ZapE [Alphaproteobacteria bacterium]
MLDNPQGISVEERYEALVDSGDIDRDSAQQNLAEALDRVLENISEKRLTKKSSSLGWLFARKQKNEPVIKGLYIHGSVGRGKTMLMDLFFDAVKATRKRRVHFHDFMTEVHERINAHRQAYKRGETKQEDPIAPVAGQLIADAWVLCFDEFSVTDITDAMILSRLFEKLFERGCVLVATSNVEPDNLYHDGLNRQLFLPFIALLKTRVDVFNLDARTDYRLEKTNQLPIYLTPLGDETTIAFAKAWQSVASGHTVRQQEIESKGRTIEVPMAAGGAARFSFEELCARPLGTGDYRRIAERYHTIFIENIPVMEASARNEAKRFINLIDMLYDSKIRVFLSAAAAPDDLYRSRRGDEGFEFARTASRLFEMQSADYLASSKAVQDSNDGGRS